MAKIALLIGVSEYEPGLNPLPAAVKDVEAMRRVLENSQMGDFGSENIIVLKDPQRQEMEESIFQLFSSRDKDDLVLFYFSGHGIKDETGRLYLSTRGTRKQNGELVTPSAVAASFLHESINNSKSQRQVLILDCCFSGAIAKGLTVKDDGEVDIQAQLGGKGRAILTSSTSTQRSFEQEGSELSVYTRYLVEGLEKGAADKDGDGWITIDELHDYACRKVQEASPAMTPKFYPVEEGFRIRLAKAPVDDPHLKYRKEVDILTKEDEGEISLVNRLYVEELRNKLGLSIEEARQIEFEVQQPYRQRFEKLQRYEQALSGVMQQKSRLGEKDCIALKRLQTILNLRDEDIAPVEQRVLGYKKADRECRPDLIAQELEEIEIKEQPRSLSIIQTTEFQFEFVTLNPTKKRPGFFGLFAQPMFFQRDQSHHGQAEFFAEDLGDGVVLEMVEILGGQFVMGSPDNELERHNSESPQHTVTIQPLFMGKFPITQAQWAKIALQQKVNIDLNPDPSHFKGSNRPVECVSWNDAVEFCERLSNLTGKLYRLPSEAEWEYACRGGTTTPFHFGETITTDLANYNGDYSYGSESKGEYREETTEVGKFSPNACGLYDMHGNIWEWCQDTWHSNYEGAPVDGTAWISENNSQWLLRGGSWLSYPGDCRSASRDSYARDFRSYNVGFRVVVGGINEQGVGKC